MCVCGFVLFIENRERIKLKSTKRNNYIEIIVHIEKHNSQTQPFSWKYLSIMVYSLCDTYKQHKQPHKLWWIEKYECVSNWFKWPKEYIGQEMSVMPDWLPAYLLENVSAPFVILSKIYDYDRSGFSLALFFSLMHGIRNLRIRVSKTTITLSHQRFHVIFAAIENKREHIYEIVFIFQNHISISTFRVVFLLFSSFFSLVPFMLNALTVYLHLYLYLYLYLCAWCRSKIDYVKRHWVNIKMCLCAHDKKYAASKGNGKKMRIFEQIATLRKTAKIWIVVIMVI